MGHTGKARRQQDQLRGFASSVELLPGIDCGGALGKGVGPLLISTDQLEDRSKINTMHIAIPGANTTAHMLFSLAFPNAAHKHFTVFSAIENSVLHHEADAGVIIHENRFTYQEKAW